MTQAFWKMFEFMTRCAVYPDDKIFRAYIASESLKIARFEKTLGLENKRMFYEQHLDRIESNFGTLHGRGVRIDEDLIRRSFESAGIGFAAEDVVERFRLAEMNKRNERLLVSLPQPA